MTPSKYQQAICTYIADAIAQRRSSKPFRPLVVEAAAGSGKCLGLGTPVLMFDGSIRSVETLQVGELLMGPDSQPRKIISTTTGVGPLFQINPTKGMSWVCNDAHILTLVISNSGEVLDVPLLEYLEELKKPRSSWQSKCAKLLRTGVDFKSARPLPLDPYLLGLWIGDGSTNRPDVTTLDIEIDTYVASFAEPFGLTVRRNPSKSRCWTTSLTYPRNIKGPHRKNINKFWNFLRDNCIVNNEKHIPQEYLTASRTDRLALLAGIIDTDGYLGSNYFEVTTKLSHLRDQYLFLARSLGFAAYTTVKHNKQFNLDYHRIGISGDVDQIPTKLSRKQASPRKQIKSVLRTGFTVEAFGTGAYYGFTLDGNDGRFLLGDFTITHNTATLVEAARHNPSAQFVMIAFGKRNADELAARLPPNARASTAHSLGSRAWTETLGGRGWAPEVAVGGHSRPGKIARIVDAEVDKGRLPRWLRGKVEKLVDLARMHGIVPGSRNGQPGSARVNDVLPLCGLRDDTDDEWLMLMEHFDVYATGTTPEALIQTARTVLTTAIRYGHRIIDYTDMLYLPTLAQGSIWRLGGEVLCVDELQDLDHLQRQMVLHLLGTGCLFVGTGDSRQAIFGWRGADADSMQKICQATNAVRLPLSICYRCPTSHLDRARALSPSIEARPCAPLGLLEVYDEEGRCVESNVGTVGKHLAATQFRAGDLVICRSKAPLVRAAYELLKHNVPARILGRDLGRGLLAYVDAMRAPNVTALLQKVEQLTAKAIQRAVDLDDDQALAEAGDRRDVLVAVADGLADDDEWNNIDVYREHLLELFGDGEDRARVVTLSTIHRAKGAEADRVWWLDHTKPDLTANYKREAWRRESECLRFVALTRARQELRLIHSIG